MGLSDDLTSVLRAAPELNQAPGLAYAAAQTTDPTGNAQALAQAGNTQAATGAVNDLAARHGGHSLLGSTMGFLSEGWRDARHILGAGVGGALHLASAGLNEVQHQYRYTHDIVARHGIAAGILEGTVLAAGAVAGVLLAPEIAAVAGGGALVAGGLSVAGGVLGAEVAHGATARLNPMYTNSWDATTDGEAYRDPHNGQMVSPGRDLAHLLGLKEHKGLDAYSIISGVTDGFFDMAADPAMKLGEATKATRAARIGLTKVEDVERAYNVSRGVRSAMEEMAGLDAGQVPLRFPKFAAMSERIGAAKTPEEVLATFKKAFGTAELVSDRAPTRSVLGALGVRTKIAAQEATGPIVWAKAMLGHLPAEAPEKQTLLSNLTRKLGNNVPTYIDDTGNQVTGAFDVMGHDAVRVVHQTLRAAGAPNQLAEDVATTFASTRSVAQRISIYKNSVVEAVLSQVPESKRALLNDSEFIKNLRTSFDDAVPVGTEVGRAEQYGHDINGQSLSKVMDGDGGTHSAGILASHIGLTAIPNYDEVRTLVRAKSNFNQILGKTDDFFLDNFTQKLFKPLVLVQPGTGMRIGAAEAVTGVARFGLRPYVRTVVGTAISKMRGPQALEGALDPSEMSNFEEAMGHLAGGVEKLAGLKPKDAELMAKYLEHTGGSRVPMAVRAGHGVSEDLVGRQAQYLDTMHTAYQDIPKNWKVGDDFAEFGNTDARHAWHWQAWLRSLSKDEATQKAATEYLAELERGGTSEVATQAAAKAAKEHWDGQPLDVLERYHRHFDTAVPGADPHTEWGQVIAENLKGATHTPEGVPNVDLLKAVADGKIVTRETLEALPTTARPQLVPGRTIVPDMAGSIEKVASWGHRKFVEPIVNTFAREPLFFEEWKTQYKALEKGAVAAGDMGEEEAMSYASQRAIAKMRPLIHNVNERSLFSRSVQNWIPFYFAQEQAYRRLGRLLIEDPGAFRRSQLAMSALHDVAHPAPGDDGSTGQDSIMMPGTGFLGKYVPAAMNVLGFHTLGSVPVGFAGSLQSLQTVSPLVEDVHANFGPVVVFAGKTLAHIFPESTGFVDKVIGDVASSGSAWDTLIPNTTLRRVWQAQRMDSRANQAAMMNIIQLESFKQEQAEAKWIAGGSQGPKPQIVPGPEASAMERQQFLDRVKNHTRILDYVKAAIGFVSPVSPQFKFGDTQISDDLRKLISEKGNLGDAVTTFLERNPDATPYTVFQSASPAGSPVQSTHPAQQWITANEDVINKYPAASFYLVPQGGKFDSAVYNEQLAMGLRRKRTPEEFLQQIYIAQGNEQFYAKDRPAYTQALVAAKDDKAATARIKANWQAYIAAKATANPVWFDEYSSQDRQNAKKVALTQLQEMFSTGAAPPGAMTDAVGGLLHDYETLQAAGLPGRTDQAAVAHRKTLNIRWEQYLDGLVKDHPELSPITSHLFRSLSDTDRQMAGLGTRPTS